MQRAAATSAPIGARPGRGGERDERSKSERAYETIRDRIADGTYGSGYRLVLDQLALELSVSPVPVREALRRLEAEGYVVYRRNVGAHVASIDVAEYLQVMEVLAVLEAAATALGAPLLTPAELAEARSVNDAMRACLEGFDPLEFTRRNRQLHQILHVRCPNKHLQDFIAREWTRMDAIRRSSFSFVPKRAHATVSEHDHLLDLIEAHAPADQIEAFCREHRMATATALEAWHRAHQIA